MTPRGLLLSDDMIFSSRITATARAHGIAIDVGPTVNHCLVLIQMSSRSGVILDLHNETLDIKGMIPFIRERIAPHAKIIGYGSHVDKATLQAARDAGVDIVLPRSKFVNDLESCITDWLTPTTNE